MHQINPVSNYFPWWFFSYESWVRERLFCEALTLQKTHSNCPSLICYPTGWEYLHTLHTPWWNVILFLLPSCCKKYMSFLPNLLQAPSIYPFHISNDKIQSLTVHIEFHISSKHFHHAPKQRWIIFKNNILKTKVLKIL